MKQSSRLILGSWLALILATPGLAVGGINKSNSAAQSAVLIRASVNHQTQAKELLGAGSEASHARSDDMAIYINKKVRQLLPEPWRPRSARIAQVIIETADMYKMDPLLLMSVIRQESRFKPTAVGAHGEIGLMQIKPSTAQSVLPHEMKDEDMRRLLMDPEQNIRIATAYLAELRRAFHGRGIAYLSAYNAGETTVRQKLRNGERMKIYSDKVLAHYRRFSNGLKADQLERRRSIASAPATTLRPTFVLN